MKLSLAAVLGLLLVFLYMCLFANSPSRAAAGSVLVKSAPNSSQPIDFDKQIKPIFEAGCQPCHFNGGVMYERLPFDRAETIRKLGDKLFTRIKNENEQRLIREFLKQ
jgi:hypothetical protein